MTFQNELETALEAVRRASILCRSVQSKLESAKLQKGDRSPVTVADFGSQAVVCRALQRAFPDDPVIAEEDASVLRGSDHPHILDEVVNQVRRIIPGATSDQVCGWIDLGNASEYSERFWTLDPIDGTKGFLRDDQYAVALALLVNGEVVVSALACPRLASSTGTGCVFGAARDRGAFSTPLDHPDKRKRVFVSDVDAPGYARFCESFESEHSSHGDAAAVAAVLGITREPLRLDSQAKYAVVARGEAEIYLRLTGRSGYVENIWDHAAGLLVVEEAGGRVTDIHGRRLNFRFGPRLERNVGVVASNGRLHDRVLEALDRVLVSD